MFAIVLLLCFVWFHSSRCECLQKEPGFIETRSSNRMQNSSLSNGLDKCHISYNIRLWAFFRFEILQINVEMIITNRQLNSVGNNLEKAVTKVQVCR